MIEINITDYNNILLIKLPIADLKVHHKQVYFDAVYVGKILKTFTPWAALQHLIGKQDTWNLGDWTSLDTVEIGDTVGGVKISKETQKNAIRYVGEFIKRHADVEGG